MSSRFPFYFWTPRPRVPCVLDLEVPTRNSVRELNSIRDSGFQAGERKGERLDGDQIAAGLEIGALERETK